MNAFGRAGLIFASFRPAMSPRHRRSAEALADASCGLARGLPAEATPLGSACKDMGGAAPWMEAVPTLDQLDDYARSQVMGHMASTFDETKLAPRQHLMQTLGVQLGRTDTLRT